MANYIQIYKVYNHVPSFLASVFSFGNHFFWDNPEDLGSSQDRLGLLFGCSCTFESRGSNRNLLLRGNSLQASQVSPRCGNIGTDCLSRLSFLRMFLYQTVWKTDCDSIFLLSKQQAYLHALQRSLTFRKTLLYAT